jgi:hypothetical protein
MTTIKLNAGAILAFDGKVVEHFYGAVSKRAHVGTLHDVQIETDRKGKHLLHINSNPEPTDSVPGGQLIYIDEKVYAQVNQLVSEIQEAISSFHAENE